MLETGKRVLEIEARAIEDLIRRMDRNFTDAVDLLFRCEGRVVVTGMGKSGLIGKKISATLASTGTPSFFLHPAEGIHGDLGMVMRKDVILALSNSGETEEILALLPTFKRMDLKILSLTGRPSSTLARSSNVTLDVGVKEEACPMNLVPTASTTATLAMGDALAVALLDHRGFKAEDFAFFHPGGTLGRRLLLRVEDVMHRGDEVPKVSVETLMKDAIVEITSKKMGVTTVADGEGRLAGILTDGDLRRLLETERDIFTLKAGAAMTPRPKVIYREALAAEAIQRMEAHAITSLVVVDRDERIEGIVHLHDLLKKGIV
ncbi:MAG: KpsF/GutQ family sugar-phosphate isomerase [Nitrospirae bacterium]|nr:KpsF/GutQ family sugar-phosphate isomerase [Nitrospirota bacterium]